MTVDYREFVLKGKQYEDLVKFKIKFHHRSQNLKLMKQHFTFCGVLICDTWMVMVAILRKLHQSLVLHNI